MRNLAYDDKPKHLNLHSLRGDLIKVYKWMKGFYKGDVNRDWEVKERGRTHSSGLKLDNFRFSKDMGKNWFTNSDG